MTDEVIYYRNELLVTPEQKERIQKLYDLNQYDTFDTYYWNPGYNTGLPWVINLLSYIENDRRFNDRDNELRERIKQNPKCTPSTGRLYNFVEEKLLVDLLWDAFHAYKREFPDDSTLNDTVMRNSYLEFMRIYEIPYYQHIMAKIQIYGLPNERYFYKLQLTKKEQQEFENKNKLLIYRNLKLSCPESSILHGTGNGFLFDRVAYKWVYGDIVDYIDKMRNYGRRATDYKNNERNTWNGAFWWDNVRMNSGEWHTDGLPFKIIYSEIVDLVPIVENKYSAKNIRFKIIIEKI